MRDVTTKFLLMTLELCMSTQLFRWPPRVRALGCVLFASETYEEKILGAVPKGTLYLTLWL